LFATRGTQKREEGQSGTARFVGLEEKKGKGGGENEIRSEKGAFMPFRRLRKSWEKKKEVSSGKLRLFCFEGIRGGEGKKVFRERERKESYRIEGDFTLRRNCPTGEWGGVGP